MPCGVSRGVNPQGQTRLPTDGESERRVQREHHSHSCLRPNRLLWTDSNPGHPQATSCCCPAQRRGLSTGGRQGRGPRVENEPPDPDSTLPASGPPPQLLDGQDAPERSPWSKVTEPGPRQKAAGRGSLWGMHHCPKPGQP